MRSLLIVLSLALAGQSPAPDAAQVFRQGQTWDDFLPRVSAQRETWIANGARNQPASEMVERVKRVSTGLQWLVISEPACSDSVQTVPYIAGLAAAAGIEMRMVDRTLGQPFMNAHRTPDGRAATPTVVVLRNGVDAGAWVERPEVLQSWFIAATARNVDREERLTRKRAWYEWDRGESTRAELVALSERTVVK